MLFFGGGGGANLNDCKVVVNYITNTPLLVGKFIGYCNEAKADVDVCFKMEKEKKRSENARIAKEKRIAFEESLKEQRRGNTTSSYNEE